MASDTVSFQARRWHSEYDLLAARAAALEGEVGRWRLAAAALLGRLVTLGCDTPLPLVEFAERELDALPGDRVDPLVLVREALAGPGGGG